MAVTIELGKAVSVAIAALTNRLNGSTAGRTIDILESDQDVSIVTQDLADGSAQPGSSAETQNFPSASVPHRDIPIAQYGTISLARGGGTDGTCVVVIR